MSPVDQVLMLWMGIVAMELGKLKIDLAWASRSPKTERFFGWVLRIAGFGFILRAAVWVAM